MATVKNKAKQKRTNVGKDVENLEPYTLLVKMQNGALWKII
jgi:hypothetical protein